MPTNYEQKRQIFIPFWIKVSRDPDPAWSHEDLIAMRVACALAAEHLEHLGYDPYPPGLTTSREG